MTTKKELERVINKLEKENARLQDENASLWFMLDELEQADKAAKKVMDEQSLIELLSQMEPVGEA